MAEESKKSSGKGWLIAITIILAIIILILHKDEMKFEGYFKNHS